jgi:hypothetical protein
MFVLFIRFYENKLKNYIVVGEGARFATLFNGE